jgi:hypothetical protein
MVTEVPAHIESVAGLIEAPGKLFTETTLRAIDEQPCALVTDTV